MAVKIRLTRGGAKNRPYYNLVAADSRMPRDGRFIEKLGAFDPLVAKDSPTRLVLKKDRIEYWLSVGAQPSDRVLKFLNDNGLGQKTTQVKKATARKKEIIEVKTKIRLAAAAKAKAEADAKAAAEAAEIAAKEAEAKAAADAAAAPAPAEGAQPTA